LNRPGHALVIRQRALSYKVGGSSMVVRAWTSAAIPCHSPRPPCLPHACAYP
jgi:hypothetical protein